MLLVTVYRKEIRDIYSTSKVSFNRMISSWWTFISRKQNGRQTRCRYKVRYHQKGEESQVRLEIEKRSPFPNKQTRPTATNAQRGPYQKQTGTKRRTRIKIIDDIYGVIVGYQDPAGPSSHHQGREKPQQHETYRKELESFDSVGIQPRCHMKTVMEEKRVARKNSDAAIRSHLNIRTARSTRSSMLSTPNSHVTPDMIRMRDIACRVKRGRCRPQLQVRATPFPQVSIIQLLTLLLPACVLVHE